MNCTDSSFLIDYLTEDTGPATEFLEDHEDEPFYAPAIALFEVYCGPRTASSRPPVDEVATNLDWIEPLSFTEASAREAARVRREVWDRDRALSARDALIAGDIRRVGGTLVTNDADFEAVDGLMVATYK